MNFPYDWDTWQYGCQFHDWAFPLNWFWYAWQEALTWAQFYFCSRVLMSWTGIKWRTWFRHSLKARSAEGSPWLTGGFIIRLRLVNWLEQMNYWARSYWQLTHTVSAAHWYHDWLLCWTGNAGCTVYYLQKSTTFPHNSWLGIDPWALSPYTHPFQIGPTAPMRKFVTATLCSTILGWSAFLLLGNKDIFLFVRLLFYFIYLAINYSAIRSIC